MLKITEPVMEECSEPGRAWIPNPAGGTQRCEEYTKVIDRYSYRDITTLVDAKDMPHESKFWPTRKNIVSAMEKLISGKQPGDHIVFSFSGHSSQVQAIFDLDEVDDMDEILLPVDVICNPANQRDYFENFIRDNEIRDIFVNQLPKGVRCAMIFDCTHSGTLSDLPSVEDSSYGMSRILSSPLMLVAPSLCIGACRERSHGWRRLSLPSLLYLDKETSWLACMGEQQAFASKRGGLFTREFTQILASTPHPTHKQLLEELSYRYACCSKTAFALTLVEGGFLLLNWVFRSTKGCISRRPSL